MTTDPPRGPNLGELIEFQGRIYKIGDSISKGHFGTVYECADEWGNSLIVKVLLPKDEEEYDRVRENWLHELGNLMRLRHPNVTFAHDAFEHQRGFYLVLERCEYSLDGLIAWPGLRGELWVLPIARCILQALHFLHRAGYVHKDLHAGNVFSSSIRSEMNPEAPGSTVFKIGDLGISRLAPEIDIFNTILAQWMLPPEFLDPAEFGILGSQVDIYHAGLLFLSLLLGSPASFSKEEILQGKPRELAESLNSPYRFAIARALRRHVHWRTQTALEFWKELSTMPPQNPVPAAGDLRRR
jgi:serine/threonine protein kinase